MLCFLNNQFTIILHFNQHHPQIMQISAAPDPVPSPTYSTNTTTSDDASTATQTESKINFSPPLIAMVIVIVTAFLIITYSRLFSKHVATPILNCIRQWRRRRRRRTSHVASSSAGDLESFHHLSNQSFLDSADHYQTFSPYGLDDSIIKTIPLSIYNSHQHRLKKQSNFKVDLLSKDCAVCLLEFEENDYLRTLPICSHAFHVDCIDIWLRSHANCPLCRARIILRSESRSSPFVPLMAGRIRPSLDSILDSILLEPLDEIQSGSQSQTQTPEQSILGTALEQEDQTFDFVDRRNLLKRSHSFGFERSFQPSMTSPWRRSTTASFWNKRRLSVSSPFSALTKSRVFSFRSTRLTKSPFFARRGRGGLGLFPFSETPSLASLSRRRSKSMVSTPAAGFSSSRLRCGDPEALLSPERFNRR